MSSGLELGAWMEQNVEYAVWNVLKISIDLFEKINSYARPYVQISRPILSRKELMRVASSYFSVSITNEVMQSALLA